MTSKEQQRIAGLERLLLELYLAHKPGSGRDVDEAISDALTEGRHIAARRSNDAK